jgi:predicted ATP-grasp superfamily ATP-dependent carboligase
MRVLIHEHFTSGGRSGLTLANAADHHELLVAGQGMLRPLVTDLLATGAEVMVTLAPGLSLDLPAEVARVTSGPGTTVLAEALARTDAALVIAPESDDTLTTTTLEVERAGVRNLGSSSAAVRSVSDKLLLSTWLTAAGVPTPATVAGLDAAPALLATGDEIVVKPRRSAGCVDTFVCRPGHDLSRLPDRDDWLVQERVPGLTASAAFVVTPDGVVPLRAGVQTIASTSCGSSGPSRLAYEGGRLPLDTALETRALALGRAAIEHVQGLRGFVGVDLVLGAEARDDRVIEINPRLTVAYAGLRTLARFSIADLLLGRTSDRLRQRVWRSGSVRYRADGTVTEER